MSPWGHDFCERWDGEEPWYRWAAIVSDWHSVTGTGTRVVYNYFIIAMAVV